MREAVNLEDTANLERQFIVPENCPVQAVLVSAETLVTTRFVKVVLASAKLTPIAPLLATADAP